MTLDTLRLWSRYALLGGVLCLLALGTRAAHAQDLPSTRLGAHDSGGCALARDNRVYCWGSNFSGLLGVPGAPTRATAAPVPGLPEATGLAYAWTHACALVAGGNVWCWGDNHYGQSGVLPLRRGSAGRPVPVVATQVAGLTDVVQLAAASEVTCALLRDATVRCWGANWMLGGGSSGGNATPTALRGLAGVSGLYAAESGLYAVMQDGTVRGWGSDAANTYGQFGAAGRAVRAPTPVPGLAGVRRMVGSGDLACAVHTDGGVSCWGANSDELFGPSVNARCSVPGVDAPPTSEPCRTRPQRIAGITDAAQVALIQGAILVRRRDGGLLSWGRNQLGQSLAADAAVRHAPGPVANVTGVEELAQGSSGSCYRTSAATLCLSAATHRYEPVAGLP